MNDDGSDEGVKVRDRLFHPEDTRELTVDPVDLIRVRRRDRLIDEFDDLRVAVAEG